MTFKASVREFVEKYLTPNGLSKDIFDFNDLSGTGICDSVGLPSGNTIIRKGNAWCLGVGYDRGDACNVNYLVVNDIPYHNPDVIKQYQIKEKMRKELKKSRAECEELKAENAKLRAELLELRLRPGGEEYLAAEEHFNGLIENTQ